MIQYITPYVSVQKKRGKKKIWKHQLYVSIAISNNQQIEEWFLRNQRTCKNSTKNGFNFVKDFNEQTNVVNYNVAYALMLDSDK